MKKIEEKLIDEIISCNYSRGEYSDSFILKTRKKLKLKLKDPANYLSYSVYNGNITKLVFAEYSETAFEFKRIQVMTFLLAPEDQTKKNVSIELGLLQRFFKPKKLKLLVAIKPQNLKLQKVFKSLNAYQTSSMLRAKVNVSLREMKKMTKNTSSQLDDSVYTIRPMNFKQDIDKVMNIERKAHKNESTSVVHSLPRKEWNFFREILAKISKQKTAFVLMENNKIIGFTAFHQLKDKNNNCMVTTISLDPSYKGQGLGKLMYLHLLQKMQDKNIDEYYGFTNTKQVLKLATKLKRKSILDVFTIDKSNMACF